MRRKAIVAAVDLRDGQRDALARRGFQRALGKRTVQSEISFERCRTAADEAEQVRYHAELLFDGLKQGLGGCRRGFDRGGGGEAGHGVVPFFVLERARARRGSNMIHASFWNNNMD